MDASEIHAKRLNAKEAIMSKSGETYIYPFVDGTVKPYGGDQALRTSTLIRNQIIRGESHQDFLGESEGSPPPAHFQDSLPDAGEARDDFWSIAGDFIYRYHVEPRVKLYTPREESFPITLKHIDVTRFIHTTSDVMQESRIDDYWNIDGSRDLSDSWTGFTQFTFLKETPLDGYMWSGRRLTKRQATSRPDHLWPEIWRGMSRNSKMKEKQNWANEKPMLENARKLKGVYFIDPEDNEFKEIIKNARKKLEVPAAPAMPCNRTNSKHWVHKSKLACILEAEESKRLRMEGVFTKNSGGPCCRKRE